MFQIIDPFTKLSTLNQFHDVTCILVFPFPKSEGNSAVVGTFFLAVSYQQCRC